MIFSRFRRPKWKHPDPCVRREAVGSGSVPEEQLARVVHEDQDPQVRRLAVVLLGQPRLLHELAIGDRDQDVRTRARERLVQLLIADPASPPPLVERLVIVKRLRDPELAEQLALRAQDPDIRLAALVTVTDTETLCAIAVGDNLAAVRRAALDQVVEPWGWERVAREARGRDKQVARTARAYLQAHRRILAQQEQASALCVAMEALAEAAPAAGTGARFRALVSRWERIEPAPAREAQERFARARSVTEGTIARFAVRQDRARALCGQLEGLVGELRAGTVQEMGRMEEIRASLQQVQAQWREPEETLQDRFRSLREELQAGIQDLSQALELQAGARSMLDRGRESLSNPSRIDEQTLEALERAWRDTKHPPGAMGERLQGEFDALLRELRGRLKQERQRREQALAEAEGMMADLETALAQGELQAAVSFRDRIRHRLKVSGKQGGRRRPALHQAIRPIEARLEELLRWRHWGSSQAREHLIEEVQALPAGGLGAEETAARVRRIRDAWRRIDHQEGAAPEALWACFDAACNQAYAPYQRRQEEQARQRKQALERKRALLGELQAYERETDWKGVDWPAADRRVRAARQRWRRLGPVPRPARKALEGTYQETVARLETHLNQERERELRRRRALIQRIEPLAGAEDLRQATEEVKRAQAQWRPTVQASRAEEQALWDAFRGACDAVFERQRALCEEADLERQDNLANKRQLCDELEAALEAPDMDMEGLDRHLAQVEAGWGAIGAVPRGQEAGLERRLAELKQRLGQRRGRAVRDAREVELRVIQERSALCARLERAVLGEQHDGPGPLEVAEGQWAALGGDGVVHQEALDQRFRAACDALRGDAVAQGRLHEAAAGHLQTRRRLCLEMEILAGVDSPPAFAAERMRLQVSRLSEALHQHGEDPEARWRSLIQLQRDWALSAPVPLEEADALERRFAGALAAAQAEP
jgi:exonuclease SbcC